MPWQDHEAREHVSRTEAMLARLDALADPAARAQALGAVQAIVELYGECLARIMRQVTESADGAPAAAIAGDELVSHLLLVHDLQHHFLSPFPAGEPPLTGILANTARLLDRARRRGVPVVRSRTDAWPITAAISAATRSAASVMLSPTTMPSRGPSE